MFFSSISFPFSISLILILFISFLWLALDLICLSFPVSYSPFTSYFYYFYFYFFLLFHEWESKPARASCTLSKYSTAELHLQTLFFPNGHIQGNGFQSKHYFNASHKSWSVVFSFSKFLDSLFFFLPHLLFPCSSVLVASTEWNILKIRVFPWLYLI